MTDERLDVFRACLDAYAGRFRQLNGARTLAEYLERPRERADEEILTEPVLADLIERLLGFPRGAYFPQFGRGGSKPDFTPTDLIAHSFVLDAKSSTEELGHHEAQIRRYMRERSLDAGVLFNLREMRVYRRGSQGADQRASFSVVQLWQIARSEAIDTGEVAAFRAFCDLFAFRELGLADKIEHVRNKPTWSVRLAGGDEARVDVEFLVERLRALSLALADDAAAQLDELDRHVRLNPGLAERIVRELQVLVLDLAPRTDVSTLPTALADWRTADGLAGRAWRQYLLRVAYLSLIRILLYRAWEDVEFVDSYLFDGGFGRAYDHLSQDVRRVLDEAFLHGAQQYRWLFAADSNYDWFRPRPDQLVEVLYSLAPVPLGMLDADVLGSLYESYVEDMDRDRLGQFYTPRSVVRFMLDRVGFAGPEGVFRIEGDERRPLRVLDFATGSGGFLVEAARRVIDAVPPDDPRGLEEGLEAIVTGFVGGEISPFPYYLTEVNLLLQVSRLLGRLAVLGVHPPRFVLGVLHVDTLGAKSDPEQSLAVDPSLRADRAEIQESTWFGLVPLDAEKRARWRDLRADGSFDLVVGNPPYVAEANNKPLFDLLRSIPGWKGIYRGKTDYLYYFLLLAVEKLTPGGRLCVIVPAGWMNAGAADFLRERLAAALRIDEIFLFGSYRLFAPERSDRRRVPTPTVESAILVATKAPAPPRHRIRVVALEDEAEVASALESDGARSPDRDRLLAEFRRLVSSKPARKAGIRVHDVPQAGLKASSPWNVKRAKSDVGTRVVACLEAAMANQAVAVEALSASWRVVRGIETGADAYTERIDRRLDARARASLAAAGCRTGHPVMELPAGLEREVPWVDHPELLAMTPEPHAILFGTVDPADYSHLLLLSSAPPPRAVLEALEPWRPLLSTRAEVARNPRRSWWETLWPRSEGDRNAPKVMGLYRTDRGRFALDEDGSWKPSNKITFVVGRKPDAPVAYLCGLLNSELLDLWYAVRGKTPWHVRRNYEPLRMNEMPYRRPGGDPRADEVADLVRRIAANRQALLPHRAIFPELGRIVKDPWKTGPVALDPVALVASLVPAETISIRLDPSLAVTLAQTAPGRAARRADRVFALVRGRVEVARIEGDPRRLDMLEAVLGAGPVEAIEAALLPRDQDAFDALSGARALEVERLLAEGRQLVERVERLVCGLYEVPADVTEDVVAHAVRRAGAGSG